MRKITLIVYLILIPFLGFSQIININSSSDAESSESLPNLVQNVLISGSCTAIDNFSEQVFGTPTDLQNKSYGYFSRPLGSSFPFESGIVLSTGRAAQAGNTLSATIVDNTLGMGSDNDLQNALGVTGTEDATFIKFNFTPLIENISFRYIMASEEYGDNTECDFADGFAFLLREVGTTTYTNLAVLPDGTPVSVTNINDSDNCPANQGFFAGYDINDTNFGGRTIVLTAMANVIPNTTYEIKLVVADQGDSQYDSAIFLEAGSFNLGVDLGADRTIASGNAECSATGLELDTSFASSPHVWYKDGVQISGAVGSILNINESGTYTVEVNLGSGCSATDQIEVEFYDSPVVAAEIPDQIICDDNNDGLWTLNLDNLKSIVFGAQSTADFSVTFHSSLADAESNSNALALSYTNAIAYTQEEIFVRIENNNGTDCYATDSFLFNVFNTPTPIAAVYELCDNADDGDDANGFIEFDLSTIEDEVLNGLDPTLYDVTFHIDQANADSGSGDLPLMYTNATVNMQQIIARVETIANPDCYVTVQVDLIVNPLPVITALVELRQCDDDTDGITQFNLTEANTLVSADASNETITFYLTQAQAEGGLVADQIANPLMYQNPTPITSTVYTRIETNKGCWRTAQIDLVVGATQIPSTFNLQYNVCDTTDVDGDDTNGIANFNFSDATAQIQALFPVGQNITISYYTNLADALAELNAIADISDYRNETSPNTQSIFVRIDSDDVNACLGLGEHITLTVDPLPLVNTIIPYTICSDTNQATFNLTTKDAEVIGAQTQPMLITYHESLTGAQNNTDVITGPYPNQTNPQTIYVRAVFDDNGNGVQDAGECHTSTMSFQIEAIPNPVLVDPGTINECNNQVNTMYNLTQVEDQVRDGNTSISLTYYESMASFNAGIPIPDPTMYLSTSLANSIVIAGTLTNGCVKTITINLQTTIYDNLNTMPSTIEECEIDTDGFDSFDVTRRETEILNGLNAADFTFTYYELETDAIAGNANSIPNVNDFTNTVTQMQTIYVRVDPVASSCFQVIPITLIVNQVPQIDIEPEYLLCLDANDMPVNPGTNTFMPVLPIDTQLNTTDYSIQWYSGTTIAPEFAIAGATNPVFSPTAAGEYTVVATNLSSGCTIPATTLVTGSYPPEEISVTVLTEGFSNNNTIEVSVIGNGNYQYSLGEGYWQDESIFNNLLGGNHTVYVRDIYGCNTLIESLTIIDYPKFFTPNGDGYNDVWNIKGLVAQPNAKIYIFDRFGKLIKQISALTPGWDGTYNGEPSQSDDYWFTVEYLEPKTMINKKFTAHFTLKR